MYATCVGPEVVLAYQPKVCILDETTKEVGVGLGCWHWGLVGLCGWRGFVRPMDPVPPALLVAQLPACRHMPCPQGPARLDTRPALPSRPMQIVCDPPKIVLNRIPGGCTHKYNSASSWKGKVSKHLGSPLVAAGCPGCLHASLCRPVLLLCRAYS